MKELSTEQKAKAYDKAKSIMKKYIESGNAGVIAENTIKKAFPELRGSEDERIRKALIDFFSEPGRKEYILNGFTVDDILTWLEKQNLVIEMKTPEESLGIDSDTYSKVVDECIYGEQKPNDNQFTPEQAGVLDKHIDKFLEQNRTWSEEDEQYVKDTLALLAFGVSVHTISQVQDWLNSLKDKYTWKPTDAQMASITCAVRKMKESACYDSELVSLINDLKKLMEE